MPDNSRAPVTLAVLAMMAGLWALPAAADISGRVKWQGGEVRQQIKARQDQKARVAKAAGPVAARVKTLHKRLIAKDTLSKADLQFLADNGDGLAAFKYANLLEASGDAKVLPSAMHYYAMATYLNRDFAMRRLIALMNLRTMTLSTGHLKSGHDALAKLAIGGNTDAALALSQMYQTGWPFAQDSEAAQHWLTTAAQAGSPDAALKMATAALMPPAGTPPDPQAARAALALLATSKDPGKIAVAAALLARLDAGAAPAAQEISP